MGTERSKTYFKAGGCRFYTYLAILTALPPNTMISAALLGIAFLAGKLVPTTEASTLRPLLPAAEYVQNNITVVNDTKLPYQSAATVGNLTTLIFNDTAIIINETMLLSDFSETPDPSIVSLDPTYPLLPLVNVTKREIPDHNRACRDAKARGAFDGARYRIATDSPIRYVWSYCGGARRIYVACQFYDIFGNRKTGLTHSNCPRGQVCEETGRFQFTRAWCRPGPSVDTRDVQNGQVVKFGVRSSNPEVKLSAAVSTFYDAADGKLREVQSITFITSTPDHTRTELDLSHNFRSQSKASLIGYNDGWDIYVTPSIVPAGVTFIDTQIITVH